MYDAVVTGRGNQSFTPSHAGSG
ncbi:hypothetical protein EMIT047CA2_50017 [Pseudomonas soli]